MRRSRLTHVAARLIVTLAVGAFINKALGPKAGIAGALITYVAHDALDAPVAAYLDRLITGT